MQTQHMLAHFAKHIGIPDARFDSAGLCQLTIDEKEEIALRYDSDEVITLIGTISTGVDEALDSSLMHELLVEALSPLRHGPGLGIEPTTNSLILYWSLALTQTSLHDFCDHFSQFLELMKHWQARLNSSKNTPTTAMPHGNLV